MAAGKKSKKKTNDVKPYNTDLIMSRVLYLVSCNQLDFTTLFYYELAPVVTSLLKNSSEARYPTAKSVLKNKLKVEVSSRGIEPDAFVVDGGGMLDSAIYWPKDGLVSDLLTSIENYISKLINVSDSYIIFDRYYKKSIKSDTRLKRVDGFKRTHHLAMSSPLPAKEICMTSIKTTKNLIAIIAEYLLEKFTSKQIQHKLIVTSDDVHPEETSQGIRQKREDLESHYDEADYIVPQQVEAAIQHGNRVIKVISADTDVFVLLCYHYLKRDWSQAEVYFEDFQAGKKIVSIRKTVEKHVNIIPSLTVLYAISGCDSAPGMFGIGKAKALSALKKMPLEFIGKIEASKDDVIREGKAFVSKVYGMKDLSSSKNRLLLWKKKTDAAKLTAKPPSLKYLPPTDEALELNISRGHHQGILWDNCILCGRLPPIDPGEEGWEEDPDTGVLKPTMLPNEIDIAPEEVLRTIKCNCTVSLCRTIACSCHKANFPCTVFCGCECIECQNPYNLGSREEDDEDEDEDDNADENNAGDDIAGDDIAGDDIAGDDIADEL